MGGREIPELLGTSAVAVEHGDYVRIQATLVDQIPTFAPFVRAEQT